MPIETPSPSPTADLAAENTALKAKVAQFEAAKTKESADEIIIAEKMSRGLRREQAVAVLKRQREFDARQNTVKETPPTSKP